MTKIFTPHLLMLLGWLLLSATNLQAQEIINLRGTVLSENGDGLPGISILEKGTNNGTLTDLNGNFSIAVSNANAILRFSFLGYRTQEIRVNSRTDISLTMEEEEMGLDEVLVIGYGSLRRSDLTGSVSRVSADEINAFPTSNILQAMTGRTSGVQIIQNTGAPGSPVSVRVRGTNSIQGGNEPLYVIDGFPFSGNPTNLNNADIASIEVLKDASATAIYGSRGANGVVLITTKRGRAGQTSVEIEGSYGFQQLRKKLDLMNGREYAQLQNLQAVNDNITPYFSESEIARFGEGFDWQDLVFRQAALKTGSVNITGGTERTTYALSGSYLGQEGIIQGSDYNRYSLRFNLDHELSDRLKVEFSNVLSKLVTDRRDSGGGARGNSLIGSAIAAPPVSNPYNPDGSYTVLGNQFPFMAPDIINPLNFINEQSNTIRANVTLANLAFVYNPIPEITVRISGGIENRDDRTDNYTTRNFFNSAGVASVTTGQFTSLLNENTVSFNKTFADKHQFSILGGFTYQDFQTTFLAANGTGFLSDAFQTYNLGAAATPGVPSSGYAKSVLLSYLGRVNYSFDSRYLFTFSFRSDGSSRYSAGNQWGYFPSGAVAWRISEEGFMQNTSGISDLKLRGSWGLTGNQAIQPYATLNQLFPGNTVFGNELYTTFAPGSVLPGDLRWETTEQLNIGLDVGLFNNRVFFAADYYVKNTRDLLNTVRLPSSSGFSTTIQNVGQVQNKGLELNLDAVPFTGEFSWNVNANISFNRNRVISLNNGEDIFGAFVNVLVVADNVTLLREGRPIGQFWGFVEDGYDEQGRIRFRDIDGDGNITENDKTYIGNPNPDFIFGFNSTMNFKNFELTAFFQGSYGNDIFNVSSIPSTMDYGQGMNMPKAVLYDHWTPQNPNAAFPIISRSNTVRISDRFVEDGSFVRLRNIQLGYNLPTANWGWQGVRSAQVFVSGQNLWTITGYSWWDPEVNSRGAGVQQGIDHYSYPIPKVFTLGFRAGF